MAVSTAIVAGDLPCSTLAAFIRPVAVRESVPPGPSLKCGVEIHQQLETHKLFCECPSRLIEDPGTVFRRRLRPTQSELGEVDAAALEEAKRDLEFVYEASDTCLVEADEEPPHAANIEAIETALLFALLVGARPVDEVHFMRKLVIDGSNTTGFQRSALIATDGRLEMFGRTIGLPAILVEEDAARKVEERQGQVVYRLDRLGIPLIEVSTTPDIHAPEEARAVALRIGSLLRATRRVKRGIGTIREDLNVSIPEGARCEVKGVQELALIATYVEREAARQRSLAAVAVELQGRRATVGEIRDVTESFRGSASKVVTSAIRNGGLVLALPLPGFAGTLKGKLGPEMAGHARIAGVGGLFHSDELPAYGITDAEVLAVRSALALGAEDGFALVADDGKRARAALDLAADRARAGIVGVTAETRDPKPDGSTAYSRPLPGRARMYPETDVPPLRITAEWLARLNAVLPELPEAKVERYVRDHAIHRQQAQQLVDEGWDDDFEALAKAAEPKAVATLLLYDLAQLRREGVAVESVPLHHLGDLLALVREGRFAREAMPDVLREMAAKRLPAEDAARSIGLHGAGQEEVEREIDALLASRQDLIDARGMGAEGALMGLAMERLRGRAPGRLIRDVLHGRLENLTAKRK